MPGVAIRHEVLTAVFLRTHAAIRVPMLLGRRFLTTVPRMTMVADTTFLQTKILLLNLWGGQEDAGCNFLLLICILVVIEVVLGYKWAHTLVARLVVDGHLRDMMLLYYSWSLVVAYASVISHCFKSLWRLGRVSRRRQHLISHVNI